MNTNVTFQSGAKSMPKVKKSAPKAAKKKAFGDEMKAFSKGELHSGSSKGPVVRNPAQAKAIAASVSGQKKGPGGKKGRSRNKGRS